MAFDSQVILPAIRNLEDTKEIMESQYQYMMLLDVHILRLNTFISEAKKHGKKVLVHIDLIRGLKNDEHAVEFLVQHTKPFGVISTRANVIMKAKQKGMVTVQRLFLLDTNAVEKSASLFHRTKPDYIEVLPGVIPHMITEIKHRFKVPVIAGGFVRTPGNVTNALEAGAEAISTSNKDLWAIYETHRNNLLSKVSYI